MKKTIIVCGMPRSGTRMVAQIINTFEDVFISAEFPSGVNKKMLSFLKAMDNFFDQRIYKNKAEWNKEKIGLIHKTWLANSLYTGDYDNLKYVGNKTPSNELFLRQYEKHFLEKSPMYVYCLRSPLKVISSLQNMYWNKRNVLECWMRWKRSFNIYQEMLNKYPERLVCVSFDDPEQGDIVSVGKQIANFLSIDLTQKDIKHLSRLTPAQTKESVLKGKPSVQLSGDDMALVVNDEFYQNLSKKVPFLT